MNIIVVDDHPLYRSGVVHTLHNTAMDVNNVANAAVDNNAAATNNAATNNATDQGSTDH